MMIMNFEHKNSSLHFTLTPELLDFLWEKNRYFGNQHQPKKLQGKRFVCQDSVRFGPHSAFLNGGTIIDIGSYSYVHSPATVGMSFGNYCSVAIEVTTMGVDHPFERFSSSGFTYDGRFPVFADSAPELEERFMPSWNTRGGSKKAKVEHDVWIGGKVLLANDITIGTGSIVAAGSVVTKDVAPYTIVGGNPARVIRRRFSDEICERLLKSEWYLHHFPYFKGVQVRDSIENSVEQLEAVLATGGVPKIEEPPTFLSLLSEFAGADLSAV